MRSLATPAAVEERASSAIGVGVVVERRHRGTIVDQISRRPRQLDRWGYRRWRCLQLVARKGLPDAMRAAAGISQRVLALRHRTGALAIQRLPHPHQHRDTAAVHAAALRQCTRCGIVARRAA
jgi:hypothetical protein